ncbi:MAG: amidohydrolase [Pseudomonadota bacterium]|uniref:Omega-amidase YafV n=1 Tax=Candidatus Desulfatibia profunda TaxID=2841695 RepID=A0A8J6TMJ7_9BACT|nr:amidohydrolase [Candidatus Desulfatibia profunda]MBL7178598.1 amidohydrolase [Desulfobacterales bacterium]
MRDLKVTIIQSELAWEDIAANLAAFDRKIDAIREETHLIILPEMFTTGFSMKAAKLAQGMNGSAVQWLQQKSRQMHADIVGSVIIKDNGLFLNRLLWAKPDSRLITYDKRHLFRMLGEEKVYSAGDKTVTVDLQGWKIRPFICYDLRFPAWTRNISNRFDMAIFVANWPERRALHWKALLLARAIENQCYVIGVNRVGTDGNGLTYRGDSSIIDPAGKILFQKEYKDCMYTAVLSHNELRAYRESFPAWMDADTDLVQIPE